MKSLARWLVQHAARHSPPAYSERLEEEWLADLAARRGGVAQLGFVLGCFWATAVITYDHFGTGVRTASSASGTGSLSAVGHHFDPLGLSRRTSFFLLIACLHAVVIYAFATGLTHKVIAALPEPMKISFVRQPNPRDTPPAIPEPSLPTRKIKLPAPEPSIKFPGDAIRTIDDPLPPSQLPMSRPFVPKAVTRVSGGPGAGFPNTGDYYPSSSRRIGEMGVATVRVCVDSKGQLTSNPALVQSSGSVRLDQGALELAKAGSGHYRSTTEDGSPVTDCYPFRIRFELKQ